jgi:hypothetical protein
MTISLNNARRLCTKPEFELVEASKIVNMKQLTPARLQQKVGRARRLRDKYRDLAKRQRLEARGKQAPRKSRPSQGHENTDRKAQLFQEVLERFETRAGAAAGAKKAGARKAGAKKAGAKKAGAKKAAVRRRRREEGGREEGGREEGGREEGGREEGGREEGGREEGGREEGGREEGGREEGGAKKAGAAARAAAPSKAGAAAMKGARQRPAKRGPQDAKQKAQGTVARAHTQAANRRSQRKRDSGGR